MIYVKMIGRVGNQMFYYAIARRIQIENPQYGEIILIPDKKLYDNWGGNRLIDFRVKAQEIDQPMQLSILQKIVEKGFKIIRLLVGKINIKYYIEMTTKSQPILNQFGIYCMNGEYNVDIYYNKKIKNVYISGAWENPYYFLHIKDYLKKEFVPKNDILEYNKKLLYEIENSNSVCISIRRGDFLAKGNEKFNVCSKNYYYKAVQVMGGGITHF